MANHTELDNKQRSSEFGKAAAVVLIVVLVVCVGLVAFIYGKKSDTSSSGTQAAGTEEQANPVVAVVNNQKIMRQDVLELMSSMPPQMRQIPLEQLYPIALEQSINNTIVDKKASRSGLGRDKDVKEQLARVKKQLVRAKFMENEVNERVTEDKLQEAYKSYVENFPEIEEVKAAHILVEDESTAKSLVTKLNNGESFEELAKENSKDGSAENGGDLGYFAKTDVVPAFGEAAFTTEVGTYTKKPVKSDFGYHIIRVDEKRQRPPAEYEQAKPFLRQELQRVLLEEVLQDFRSEAKIERFDINGNPLPEAQEPAAGEEAQEQGQTEFAVEPKDEQPVDNVQP